MPFKLDIEELSPSELAASTGNSSMFDPKIEAALNLEINWGLRFVGKNRFNTRHIKRLLLRRRGDKWFDIWGKTLPDGKYYVHIQRIR